MRKIITYISLIPILFGIVGFIFNFFIATKGGYSSELPLTSIQEIKEIENKIYIGLGFYNRIQVYDSNGNYIKFIPTNNRNKDFNFSINNNGDADITVIYRRDEHIYRHIQENGDKYYISRKFPLTINKVDLNGDKTIIKQPLHMSFWAGAIAPWVIAVIGFFLFFFTNSLKIMDVYGRDIPSNLKSKLLFKEIFK